jgi:hypothetical protein
MILTSVCNASIPARCRLGNRTRTQTTTTMMLIAVIHASDAHVFMTVELFMPIGLYAHLIAYHRIKYRWFAKRLPACLGLNGTDKMGPLADIAICGH